jgi:hypothetical protein
VRALSPVLRRAPRAQCRLSHECGGPVFRAVSVARRTCTDTIVGLGRDRDGVPARPCAHFGGRRHGHVAHREGTHCAPTDEGTGQALNAVRQNKGLCRAAELDGNDK